MALYRPSSSTPDPDRWIDRLDPDELLDVLGPSDQHGAPTRSVPLPAGASPLDTPADIAHGQHARALETMGEDARERFRFPLPSLDQLAGSVGNTELWVVGGRQGNGKSLFLQNMALWLLESGVPTLYLGTEQDAATLKIKQACVIVGVSHKLMLKPTPEEQESELYARSARLVQDALAWLSAEPQASTLIYGPERYISRRSLERWTTRAVAEWGVKLVIVDHLHHIEHGEGRNPVHELTQTVHRAKGMAVDLNIGMVAASQITRTGGDDLKRHTPPTAEDFAGASAIERTADVMLGIWRPLRLDLDMKALKEVRERARLGQSAEDTIYEPATMGVRCVKDRLGDAPGRQAMIAVANQRLTERGRDAYATDYDTMRHFGRNA